MSKLISPCQYLFVDADDTVCWVRTGQFPFVLLFGQMPHSKMGSTTSLYLPFPKENIRIGFHIATVRNWLAIRSGSHHLHDIFLRDIPFALHFLRDIPSARHFNCATSHLRYIPSARQPICATFQLRDISTARYPICATSQLRDIPFVRLFNCATSHLRDIPFVRLFNCATSHLRAFLFSLFESLHELVWSDLTWPNLT